MAHALLAVHVFASNKTETGGVIRLLFMERVM